MRACSLAVDAGDAFEIETRRDEARAVADGGFSRDQPTESINHPPRGRRNFMARFDVIWN